MKKEIDSGCCSAAELAVFTVKSFVYSVSYFAVAFSISPLPVLGYYALMG